jgi:hypothetical protein
MNTEEELYKLILSSIEKLRKDSSETLKSLTDDMKSNFEILFQGQSL